MAFLLGGQINWLHVRREGEKTRASCPCDVTAAFTVGVGGGDPALR